MKQVMQVEDSSRFYLEAQQLLAQAEQSMSMDTYAHLRTTAESLSGSDMDQRLVCAFLRWGLTYPDRIGSPGPHTKCQCGLQAGWVQDDDGWRPCTRCNRELFEHLASSEPTEGP